MSTYNVLVVEDSPTMRQLIVFALKRIRGLKITEANDGVDGLKKISADKFDLILTDINMPIMDGFIWLRGVVEPLGSGMSKTNGYGLAKIFIRTCTVIAMLPGCTFLNKHFQRLFFTTIQLKNSKDLLRNKKI